MISALRKLAGTWADHGFNLLYPPVCQICRNRRADASQSYICPGCISGKGGVRYLIPPFCNRCSLPHQGDITTEFTCGNCSDTELHFRYARSSVVTTPLLLKVIHGWKYNRALWFEPFLAELLIREAAPALREEKWDLIVPIPLHRLKRREREFNQAENLGYHLSKATGIPMNKSLLERVEFTQTQTKLTRKERAQNVSRAFAMKQGKKLNGEKVILLDDVLTTGATSSACAKVLRDAGASDVCVWTVARARGST
jgi:competence protein ComFC